jgi:SAM-dependent methyltransferase
VKVQCALDMSDLQKFLQPFYHESIMAFAFQANLEKIARCGLIRFLCRLQEVGLFTDTKVFHSLDQLKEKISVLPVYGQQFESLLRMFIKAGLISLNSNSDYQLRQELPISLEQVEADERSLLQQHPELSFNTKFLHSLLDRYLLILSGKENFLNILFPSGSFDTALNLYQNTPVANFYNRLTAQLVLYFIQRQFLGENIRILEVGAGTGATAGEVLTTLDALKLRKEYHYSDISNAFLMYGRQRFMPYLDCLRFTRFDINKTPESQGINLKYYDIIIATNVIHNAHHLQETLRHVNSLLRPGGFLVLTEGVAKNDYFNFIYGLTSGWWSSLDSELRIPETPLVTVSSWQKLLDVANFDFSMSVNKIIGVTTPLDHDIVFAGNKLEQAEKI